MLSAKHSVLGCIFCGTCTRPGAISRLLKVLGSTMRYEADEGVLVWGKLQWESMGTIIIGFCPYTTLNGEIRNKSVFAALTFALILFHLRIKL